MIDWLKNIKLIILNQRISKFTFYSRIFTQDSHAFSYITKRNRSLIIDITKYKQLLILPIQSICEPYPSFT